MKSIYIKTFLLSCIMVFANACVDLEEDLSNIVSIETLETEDDMLSALSAVYRCLIDMNYFPGFQLSVAYGADDITTWWAGNKAPLRVFDRFDYGEGQNTDNGIVNYLWERYWNMVYRANNIIAGLESSSASPDLVKMIDGEARFLRAYAYMQLVKAFGNMPVILSIDQNNLNAKRATVIENYIHIENDLKIAEETLPEPGETKQAGRASSAVAKTLLAELYLTWAGWPVKDESKYALAEAKSEEVINMQYFELLPIDKLWLLENQNSRESVFAVQYSESEDIRSNYAQATSFHEARGFSDVYPERQFFFDFPEGPRKDITFYSDIPQRIIVDGKIVDADPPTKPWQEAQRNHPMFRKFAISEDLTVSDRTTGYRAVDFFRYAEVLLIYAEATAHVNGGTASIKGLEALNKVKRRAAGFEYLTPNPEVDVNSATIDEIVAEKGWELAGENKRWYDLVRLEKVAEVAARRDPTEEVPLARAASEITWKQYIAPIPFRTTSVSDLVQNPEGFKIQ